MKIYSSNSIGFRVLLGDSAEAWLSREDVGNSSTWLLETDLVVTTGATDFRTAGDVEEGPSK